MSAVEWTKTDLGRIAPEFAAIDDVTFEHFAGLAADQINASAFDTLTRRKLAGCYLQAHLLTLSPPTGTTPTAAGGPIASESVGQVSVSYAVSAFAANALHTTRYGVEFRRLCRLAIAGGFVA